MDREAKIWSIYVHKSPNGKMYVGKARDCNKRWKDGRGYKKNKEFYDDILQYGWENIEHQIVATNLTAGEACDMEHYKIVEYETTNPDKGYNKTFGKRSDGKRWQESIEKQKKSKKNAKNRNFLK